MRKTAAPKLPRDYPQRIRSLRGRLGLTQARLAELLGVSYVTLNRWENAQARPSALAWRQIERLLQGADSAGDDNAPPFAGRVAERVVPYDDPAELAATPNFSAHPDVVRAVAEAERLSYGHLFNPSFATEISLVDPLPHQRIAVYEQMLRQPRLRFLLADDAGAGKTIMTGLYIREMLARRLIRRVLIVPPAGLIGNWRRELDTLFSLPFRIVTGADARAGNPFVGQDSDLLIVSVDTLAGERVFARLREDPVAPYDLVVFDEAHKLAADRLPDFTVRKTDRYRLAEALAGAGSGGDGGDGDARWALPWHAHHLLLLTATPHMGKDAPYFYLWRLLLPDALPTLEAFHAFPREARAAHFIRRTKEEMVRFDGARLYPDRVTDTLTYSLSQGPVSERALYDETTRYIRTYYNRARILNRSAARLAMSVFQRRTASSTWALLRSLERRLAKLDALVDDISRGRLTEQELRAQQRDLDATRDVLDELTGDEETPENGREQNEVAQDAALGGVVAVSLAELEAEREQVRALVVLAKQVYERGEESKFERLRGVLRDERFRDEKLLIFTEHRDTLDFLVRRLEGLGFAGRVACIHGGMDFVERQAQVEHFRRSREEGGATYMVCTDAAAEGINLQFCWLMVNYDIPWNPARLEQRMGRIHRYKQLHDPVVITNLVAATTREGRVLKTLLEKLERVRKELGWDKVFDVIGRVLEGVSLREYMERALVADDGDESVARLVEGTLTTEQVVALQERERRIYGDGGDVRARLSAERAKLEREELQRLLPGYVRRFVEHATPLLGLRIDGDLDGEFSLVPTSSRALAPLWPAFETYPSALNGRLTVCRPGDAGLAIFLRPGEPVFEALRALVLGRFRADALRGAVFVDPFAERPYIYHLALATIVRRADPIMPAFHTEAVLESRLVGVRVGDDGSVAESPVEGLLLLRGASGIPLGAAVFAAGAMRAAEAAESYAREVLAEGVAAARRDALRAGVAEREEFLSRGFAYQDAELAAMRSRVGEKARAGDPKAKGALTRIRERQRALAGARDAALEVVRREPELIGVGEVRLLARALVVPSAEPEERRRHDAEVEAIAVRVAIAHEEARGRVARDVSTVSSARSAGLGDHPGFDLHSVSAAGEARAIEVKGRAGVGEVELTENEWAKACTHGDRYWLYVVFDCATPAPRLLRIQNPFRTLIAQAKGSVVISAAELLAGAELDG